MNINKRSKLKSKLTLSDANLIIITRMNKKYEPIFRYCKLILQKFAYQKFDKDGKISIPPFTLSMWDLFEKFVNKALVKEYGKKGFDVKFQGKSKNIVVPIPDYDIPDKKYGKPSQIEPDNRLVSKNGEQLILDTKWKKKVSLLKLLQVMKIVLKGVLKKILIMQLLI